MYRWESRETERELLRRAILRQLIKEELEQREMEEMPPWHRILPMSPRHHVFNKTSFKKSPSSGKFITYMNGKVVEGPRKKKITKSKLKRKSCSCKKN